MFTLTPYYNAESLNEAERSTLHDLGEGVCTKPAVIRSHGIRIVRASIGVRQGGFRKQGPHLRKSLSEGS